MRSSTRRRVLSTSAATLALIAGCSGDSGDSGGSGGNGGGGTTVELTDDLVFDPDAVDVATGSTVTWENAGSFDHSVTAYGDSIPEGAEYFASGGFGSEQEARNAWPEGAVGGGGTFEHTFETAGTYEYFCIPHEGSGMKGTVEVG